MELFQHPASEIAGIGHHYAIVLEKMMKYEEIRCVNASGNFLFTSKEAVENTAGFPQSGKHGLFNSLLAGCFQQPPAKAKENVEWGGLALSGISTYIIQWRRERTME